MSRIGRACKACVGLVCVGLAWSGSRRALVRGGLAHGLVAGVIASRPQYAVDAMHEAQTETIKEYITSGASVKMRQPRVAVEGGAKTKGGDNFMRKAGGEGDPTDTIAKSVPPIKADREKEVSLTQCNYFATKCGVPKEFHALVLAGTWADLKTGFVSCCIRAGVTRSTCEPLGEEVFGRYVHKSLPDGLTTPFCKEIADLADAHFENVKDEASQQVSALVQQTNKSVLARRVAQYLVDKQQEAPALWQQLVGGFGQVALQTQSKEAQVSLVESAVKQKTSCCDRTGAPGPQEHWDGTELCCSCDYPGDCVTGWAATMTSASAFVIVWACLLHFF